MKVKILQSFGVAGGPALQPGDILDPPSEIALQWIREKLAKPIGLTPEHSAIPTPENTSLPQPRKGRKH